MFPLQCTCWLVLVGLGSFLPFFALSICYLLVSYTDVFLTALGELCCVALSFKYFSEQTSQTNQLPGLHLYIQTVNFIHTCTNTPKIYLESVR